MEDEFQIQIHGDSSLPTLIYLPGLHGDWTLITGFQLALAESVRFVVITYPRSITGSLEDYAAAINLKLSELGIKSGWLLAESFGSQIAWALLQLNMPPKNDTSQPCFTTEGLVLAGGFVKHPWSWGPGALAWIGKITPMPLYRAELRTYAWVAKLLHRHEPDVVESINEFVNRRTELDRLAMRHRLALLAQYDPRPVAKQARMPVYYLGGFFDPLVPWFQVIAWLRRNCPGFKGSKIFWPADHNVLFSASGRSSSLVSNWMKMPLS